ncbi:hypothetical protein, partial [Clostridium beijerinckii]|uniref:hypothetical protein n=1 Tax=Clostridium beijerinckii TaxID=1520 RepID=UPI001A9A4019
VAPLMLAPNFIVTSISVTIYNIYPIYITKSINKVLLLTYLYIYANIIYVVVLNTLIQYTFETRQYLRHNNGIKT